MSEETIFSEINDELRSERNKNLWRQYGPWVIGVAVLIVVAVGANEGWRLYQNSVAEASSDSFYDAFIAFDDGDISAAQNALNETVATGSGDYPQLAQFAQAAILAEQGDTAAALVAYDSLATTLSDQSLRDLASLQGTALMVDEGDVGAVQSRLLAMLTPEHPLRFSAHELLALTRYAAGDVDAAQQTFEIIRTDPLAGQDLLQRIELFNAQLVAEGASSAEASDAQ